ncbi:AI-2E family transporter [Candidatus Nomurabacteria bacterium]|nr:AI-2E family transporter [Candidatus Nomurabacteria bacterium]
MDNDTPISITITPKSIFTLLAVVLFALFLWKIGNILLVILMAVVLAAFVESLSKGLIRRLHFPRVIAVMLVYIVVIIGVAVLLYLFIPTFGKEIGDLTTLLNTGDGSGNIKDTFETLRAAGAGADPIEFFSQIKGSLGTVSSEVLNTVQTAFGGLVNFMLVMVISFYLSIEERGVEQFLRAVTPLQYEEYVISVWRRTEYKIGAWLRGQLLQALILATLTYLGLWIFGVPYALMLSVLAAALGMIPFGIVLAGLIALFIAYTSGGLNMMLLTFAWYALLQQLENYVLQPLIINRVTGVPPLVVLISVIVSVALFGFVGLILAIPLAVVVVEVVRDYEKEKRIELSQKEVGAFSDEV